MELPIGNVQVIFQGQPAKIGVPVKLHYGRNKSYHFKAAGTGAGTAVFQVLGANTTTQPSQTSVGDWVPVGSQVTVTFSGTTPVSDGIVDLSPWLWTTVQLVSITAGGQAEAWISC